MDWHHGFEFAIQEIWVWSSEIWVWGVLLWVLISLLLGFASEIMNKAEKVVGRRMVLGRFPLLLRCCSAPACHLRHHHEQAHAKGVGYLYAAFNGVDSGRALRAELWGGFSASGPCLTQSQGALQSSSRYLLRVSVWYQPQVYELVGGGGVRGLTCYVVLDGRRW